MPDGHCVFVSHGTIERLWSPRLRHMHRVIVLTTVVTLLALGVAAGASSAQQADPGDHPDIQLFMQATAPNARLAQDSLRQIGEMWRDGYAGIIWDLARFIRPPSPQMFRFFTLIDFLQRQTGQQFGADLTRWHDWIWDQPYDPHPDYALFKGLLYNQFDPSFKAFFPMGIQSLIRLDEIDWGGVAVNGIPPLEYPKRIDANAADYLEDAHIVFGISVAGEARAYPKRLLAWHEMALDRVGDVELTIVYCTLCGTVIPFESVVDGQHFTFGTSGLLYRSNKLIFDHETLSLWNTFEGVPVVGSLAGSGVELMPHAVVTTTWGEWKQMHPATTVLSIDTGYRYDYSEGAAYRSYFSTHQLMFQVSNTNDRLQNKEEVLVIRLHNPRLAGDRRPVAIAATFLQQNRVFHHSFGGRNLVVVTSAKGANRVYDAGDVRFVRHVGERQVADVAGRVWRITEDAIELEDDSGARRARVPAQRAFWFGWYAQFPNTVLIN